MYIDLLKINRWLYLLLISTLIIFFTYFIQSAFMSVSVYFNTYSETMTYERIQEIFTTVKKYEVFAYSMLPVLLILKILYNSFFISTATLLSEGRGYSFSRNFNVCIKAEVVFVLMYLGKIVVLAFFKKVSTVGDINFMPLSALSLFNEALLPKWAIYPLQTINLWELTYCYIGTRLFVAEYGVSAKEAFRLFCLPYLAGLLVLLTIASFLTISFN